MLINSIVEACSDTVDKIEFILSTSICASLLDEIKVLAVLLTKETERATKSVCFFIEEELLFTSVV